VYTNLKMYYRLGKILLLFLRQLSKLEKINIFNCINWINIKYLIQDKIIFKEMYLNFFLYKFVHEK